MNTDIRIEVGFLDHWKTDVLLTECGAEGVLALMRLWIFAAQNKCEGRLTGVPDGMIERVAKWRGEPGKFLQTMVDLRFIERDAAGVWTIHDWAEHNPYAANAQWRHERAKKAAAARRDRQEATAQQLLDSYKHASSKQQDSLVPAPSPAPAPAPLAIKDSLSSAVDRTTRGGAGNGKAREREGELCDETPKRAPANVQSRVRAASKRYAEGRDRPRERPVHGKRIK